MFFGYCIKISTEITPLRNRGRNTGERLTLRGQVLTAHKLRRGFIVSVGGVGLIIALSAWSTSLRSRFALEGERNSARGVEWSALHSFGCTATSCYADLQI